MYIGIYIYIYMILKSTKAMFKAWRVITNLVIRDNNIYYSYDDNNIILVVTINVVIVVKTLVVMRLLLPPTVSCHNFKSQNVKLSVSNPKNKHVAYVSVLSRISNCQSLGRKNKHAFLKADRSTTTTTTTNTTTTTTITTTTTTYYYYYYYY